MKLSSLPRALTSRKGAWASLGLALLVVLALFGTLSSVDAPSAGSDPAPTDSESAAVEKLLSEFPGAEEQSVLIVLSPEHSGTLTSEDEAAIDDLQTALAHDHELSGPMVSEDERAALLISPITVGADNTETSTIIGDLREEIASANVPLTVHVTGGPAFGADIAGAFDGADLTLLLVTIAIVAALLIFTYRSPVLWLIPLIVVAIADRAASILTNVAGSAFDLQFDAGIISVLVFGAGTNYALLLISRYREELHHHTDHRAALAQAWRRTIPAILASNVTVILSLATLAFAAIPGTRGLGIASAIGLAIALIAAVFLLPPALAVSGRRVFWPRVPQVGTPVNAGRFWRTLAEGVSARPSRSLAAGLALLAVMATGLIGTGIGLTQMEKFRVPSDSADGLEVLAEHFDAGEAQPIVLLTETPETTAALVEGTDGVLRLREDRHHGGRTELIVTPESAPGSPETLELVRDLRAEIAESADAEALVGGGPATDVDAREGNLRDLLLVAPLILAVSFLVLAVLLRSLLAPVLLLAINIISAAAAIGAGAWLSQFVFGLSNLDLQVPLMSFLFLVALGIDYTIFLVHRARTEVGAVGTRTAMIHAVEGTGAVITSAGLVLAGVFAALGVLPLVTLGQLGLIVGLGVIIDTIVVRTILVPALFAIGGEKMWWPGKPRTKEPELVEDHAGELASH